MLYVPTGVPTGTATCTVRSTCRPGVEGDASPDVKRSELPYEVLVEMMAFDSEVALVDCGEKIRIFCAAATVEDAVGFTKSLNRSLKNVSILGTMKWSTHDKPFANVPSAVALVRTAVMPVRASGVVLALEPEVKTISPEEAVDEPSVEFITKW